MIDPVTAQTASQGRRAAMDALRRKGFRGGLEDRLRYVAATFFGIFVLLLVIGIPVLLVVTSHYGLGERVRKMAEETLGGEFYEVTIARVLFDPVRGFTLEQMQIHDKTPARRLVVSADRLSISINLESLVHKQISPERIFLRDATLDIPLGPAEEPRLRLDHVRGLILCPPEQFRLTSVSFEVAGISVNASGTFANPRKFSPKAVSPKGPGIVALNIESVQRELKAIRWEGEAPALTIVASGDLSDSSSVRVESATFRSGPGTLHGVHLHDSSLEMHYADQKLTLDKAVVGDGMGILQAAGWAAFGTKQASVEFAGAFNAGVLPLLFLGQKRAADWMWIDPLRLNGRLSADWSNGAPAFNGTALLESGRFSYRGVSINSLSGGVALRDGKVLVRDLHLDGDPGKLDADVLISPGDNRLRFEASLFPAKLASAASGKLAEALSTMDFKDPLHVTFDGTAAARNLLLVKGKGTLALGKASMRGSRINSLNSNFLIGDGAATFRDIIVKMDEGTGRGQFIYDYKNWEGRFPGIRSTLDPVKVMLWIDPRIAEALKAYRFRKPPNLQVSGKVGLRNPQKNDLKIGINAPSGLGYTLIKKDLPFGATEGSALLQGENILIDIPKSKLFGGDVALKAEVSVAPGDGNYGASVHLDNVDFQSVTKLYFDYDESKGKLTADYAFRAEAGDERAMTGKGSLLINNGNVLAMPILGPLSALLNDVVPGFGYEPARKATADFTVENGVITTRNLLIEGLGFSMIGHGDIYYLDDKMNMSVRLNVQGLPGVIGFLPSKLFEYESVGSATHPKWRPKILPKRSTRNGKSGITAA